MCIQKKSLQGGTCRFRRAPTSMPTSGTDRAQADEVPHGAGHRSQTDRGSDAWQDVTDPWSNGHQGQDERSQPTTASEQVDEGVNVEGDAEASYQEHVPREANARDELRARVKRWNAWCARSSVGEPAQSH